MVTAELLIVLAVFPLPSALVAVAALIARIQLGFPVPWNAGTFGLLRGPWLSVGFQVVAEMAALAGAALVLYLLVRSREGLEAIGLGGRKLRMDLALLLPVFIVVYYGAEQLAGSHLVQWLHLHGFYLSYGTLTGNPAAFTALQVAAGISAGILEEIVVLGFLVRRLEQLGLRSSWVVVIAVAVRVSYHLYYGWDAVPIALWALASVLAYRRIRRLLPFIICHIAWDAAIPVGAFYDTAYRVMLIAAIVAGVTLTLWGGRWQAPRPGRAMG